MSYAYWRKCDFQLHTPRDPNWIGARPIGIGQDLGDRAAATEDVDRERRAWAETFVDTCVARGLEAIALTDHHEMVMVPYVQQALADRKVANPDFDLWLFPGMELTARNGVQCLILFDADLSEEWRREAQGKLGIVLADLDDKALHSRRVIQLDCSYPEIATNLDTLPGLVGRYIVLPNVSQGGQHTVLRDGAHADFRKMSYVGGYLDRGQSIATLGGTNRRRMSGDDLVWSDRFIYPLPTSDARSADFAHVGSNNCWIKLAAPTAEAIRQAFLGDRSRISIVRPALANLSLRAVRLTGSTILADAHLVISPEQCAFIGGRGSGKSSYLEYIAFGLGRSCFDFGKGEYSGSDRNAALIKDTIISAGASIELDVIQDGAWFRIARSGGNAYQPQVTYPDGSVQELSIKELRSLFPAVVYSQGELSEIGRQAGKRAQLSDLLQFVEPEFKREDDRLLADIDAAKLAVRGALQALVEAWATQYELHKLTAAKGALEQRIIALRRTLPAQSDNDKKVVARFDNLLEFDGKRSQASTQVGTVMDELTQMWRNARQAVDLASDLPEAAAFRDLYARFNAEFIQGVETLGKRLAELRTEMDQASNALAGIVDAAKTGRDTVMEKLVEHRAVTVQIDNLQNDLRAIVTQVGTVQVGMASPDEKFDALTASVEALKAAVAARGARTADWAKQIETLSGGRIEAELHVDGEWAEIRDAVDTVSAKTGSQEAARQNQVSAQIAAASAWAFLDAMRADCLAALRWKYVGAALAGERPPYATLARTICGTEKTLVQCLELIDPPRVEAIALATPRPDITLSYCDGERKIAFEKASEGQRAAALLFMLLEQPGGPLIVDQPEGDLDNKVISVVTEKLHDAKQRRQIIFASHNANIVVNGSSELVISMDLGPDGKRAIHCAGAIDAAVVCATITATMEGGEKAFRDRKSKYGY
ncbi:Type III restriction endonuclease subunit R [Sphingomonas sp. T1]|uniref:TrlF family AAA-like ATPase n=1 Tax=Sphingomonas sp. T1 TaxID=2653172 RepID=UPI0012F32F09|nr:type III restriction endonuclease subunit R [Sphingomonas sp. T1]VXD07815.1 Type III restriction endonuclease subunit R [Sphingomonas sp. T1]